MTEKAAAMPSGSRDLSCRDLLAGKEQESLFSLGRGNAATSPWGSQKRILSLFFPLQHGRIASVATLCAVKLDWQTGRSFVPALQGEFTTSQW